MFSVRMDTMNISLGGRDVNCLHNYDRINSSFILNFVVKRGKSKECEGFAKSSSF